ncbi:hypothetical protein [Mycobacterium tuberculosis]
MIVKVHAQVLTTNAVLAKAGTRTDLYRDRDAERHLLFTSALSICKSSIDGKDY